jgi:hypothetical protein
MNCVDATILVAVVCRKMILMKRGCRKHRVYAALRMAAGRVVTTAPRGASWMQPETVCAQCKYRAEP